MTRRVPQREPLIVTRTDLLAWEAAQDQTVTGIALDDQAETRFADQGAHDPDPTPYFVLDELLGHLTLNEHSHLLDVGCGTGRVLAYSVLRSLPGRVTGIELDPQLAERACMGQALCQARGPDGQRA